MKQASHPKIEDLFVFRFIHISNLEDDLNYGLFAKNYAKSQTDQRKLIANSEIIQRRDQTPVKCYPDTVVNDYVKNKKKISTVEPGNHPEPVNVISVPPGPDVGDKLSVALPGRGAVIIRLVSVMATVDPTSPSTAFI